ncbi:MAG: RagB/SusD family nutrient uptake outer membrane protein [Bacteroidetes bacterium]|nr:MAG: RagB/SusD family nutrient uptake outer membrane protein [Bacteroidota bacterium]
MKTKRRHIIPTITCLLSLMLISCSEEYLEESPPHLITAETLYTNYDGFEAGLNGLYALARKERQGRSASNYLLADMMMNGTDNLLTNHRDGWSRVAEAWQERNNAFNEEYEYVFEWLYELINAANTIIIRVRNPELDLATISKTHEENRNRILAEASVLRAWAYRHLAYLWGDVPIVLDESKGSNIRTDWQRIPVEEVWQLVKSDLLFGEKYLDIEPDVEGKLSRGVAQHYLAELYLVLDQPDSALHWANMCINTPDYELINGRYGVKADEPGVPFMDMFYDGNSNRSEGNTEALWVWQYEYEAIGGGENIMRRWHMSRYNDIKIGGVTPLELTVERGGRPRARMSLTQFAINLYEPGDDRGSSFAIRKFFVLKDENENDTGKADKLPEGYSFGDTIWMDWSEPITSSTRNRLDWPYSRKWDWANENDVTAARQFNDQIYLRLGETYLLKAEAQMKLDDLSGAAETMNTLRRRANASEITAADVTLDFILDERSRELALEEHRRYTLLRTGKWLERTARYNTNGGALITERDRLFPIPQRVIDANLTSEMSQNPGYNN